MLHYPIIINDDMLVTDVTDGIVSTLTTVMAPPTFTDALISHRAIHLLLLEKRINRSFLEQRDWR